LASQPNMLIRWRHRIEHGLYLLGRSIYRSLPAGVLRRFGPLLGRAGFVLNRRHRKVALENLATAYPALDETTRREMAQACFENFGMLLTDFLCSSKLDRDQYLPRFEVEGLQHLEAAEAVGKGVILLTGHLGNWEALVQYLALSGRSVSFVARPLDNPHMEEDFRYLRERFGNHSIPKRKAARGSLKVLRNKGTVGILMDQRVHPNEGKAYPFFGKPAYTTTMPARLSLKTGAPAVLIFGIPIDNWQRCRIVVHPPIIPDPGIESSESAVDRLTLRYLEIIEETIRDQPHLWLWMHRKWRQFDRPIPIRGAMPKESAANAKPMPEAAAEKVLSRSSRRA
jgi:KDO2-lipid IV(A) lauroyltransferase